MNLRTAITGKVARMAHVNRYSSFGVIRPENVAEHSWWVAFISMLIGGDLKYRNVVPLIRTETLLTRALVHDLSECVSGDIIRSYKYSSEEVNAALKFADDTNMVELVDELGTQAVKVLHDWRTAKDESIEGRIVRFADMAVVAFYCREEHRTGNRGILAVLEDMYSKWFSAMHDDALLGEYADQMFPKHEWQDILVWGSNAYC